MATENSFAPHSPSRRQGLILVPPPKDYCAIWDLQKELLNARADERQPDTLVLVEHPPVFTLGRRSKPEHWGGDGDSLKRMGYDVHEVERGGSVTYHGPGQIVGYPILRLRDFCPGPKVYVRMLEEVIIRVFREWGIRATRVQKLPGVWVYSSVGEGAREADSFLSSPPFGGRGEGEGGLSLENLRKIAAVGVRITRGVTMHGFSLNVNVDLKPFELITPCGIEGCQVTSMEKVLGKIVDKTMVREQIAHHFGEVFGLEWKVGTVGNPGK